MAIKRDNILSLIGSGRYHSCILTTFSFDFYFFEMKVMKWLRSCGVRNVNVFIDGYFYSELMTQVTGEEMKFSTGYSIYPIFESGIFHPKIWLLFGEKEGLLIVGSGNLTNSGNGNNDEIWGSFHFDIKQPNHAPVFSAAWEYISKLSSSVKGITGDKTTRWIGEHSQWLAELPRSDPFQLFKISEDEKIAFLYNSEANNIWHQIRTIIDNDKIIEITAVSPYYDEQGKTLEQLKSSYPDAKIDIILDETGSIPSAIVPDKRYSFYAWDEMELCRSIGASQRSKLHAKILHFKSSKGVEFCLLGSANITAAGLGLNKSANNEVCLFMKSLKGNILNKIGLKVKEKDKRELSSFTINTNISIFQTIIKNNRFSIKLLAAEVSYNLLTVYSSGKMDTPVCIALYDTNNRLLEVLSIPEYKSKLDFKIDIEENYLRYIQIVSSPEFVQVSNKIIVSNYYSLAKTHPDPTNEELEKLCSQLQNGELRNVLDLIHYAIIDESEKEDGSSIIRNSGHFSKEEAKPGLADNKLYDLDSYKPVGYGSQLYEHSILLSPSLRVLDVLKSAHSLTSTTHLDIRTDEQEENIGNLTGNDENEVRLENPVSLKLLESDKKKLKSFFKNLYGYFHHDILYKDVKVSEYKISLTDLTKYLIALELIHEFGGKSEKIEDEQSQLFFTYLPLTGEYDNDNVKGCCLNIIGDFLRLAKNGFKEYTFDYTKKKFLELKYDALVSTIACVLNISWKEDEQFYIKTLLLNALHYLGWSTTEELNQQIPTLIAKLTSKTTHLKQRSYHLEEHLHYFSEKVCRALTKSAHKREVRDFSKTANKGQIIYSSIAGIGYCYVVSVTGKNEYCLARPGFEWNENECEYINHFGNIVYSPLPLPYFTIVDL
jgi:hypothetical protein